MIPFAAATDERLSPETTTWPPELDEVEVVVEVAVELVAAGTWIVWPMISSVSSASPL